MRSHNIRIQTHWPFTRLLPAFETLFAIGSQQVQVNKKGLAVWLVDWMTDLTSALKVVLQFQKDN